MNTKKHIYKSALLSFLLLTGSLMAMGNKAPEYQTRLLVVDKAEAGIQGVFLQVDGLACSFCAYGLEQKLKKLEGFVKKSYAVQINEGKLAFFWRREVQLAPVVLKTLVDDAGYTLRTIKVIARGEIIQDARGLIFNPSNGKKNAWRIQADPEMLKVLKNKEKKKNIRIKGALEQIQQKPGFTRVTIERIFE